MFRRLIRKKKKEEPKTVKTVKKPIEKPEPSFIQTVSSKLLTAEGWKRQKLKK